MSWVPIFVFLFTNYVTVREKAEKKKHSKGFAPLTSPIPVHCSNQLSYEATAV